ncbi:uncharacterized protein LOC122652149 [Telopea speciosissima]|uniref:uncharacterized protein LOC122652149 n=1 Tax=Telopea speciosissima TaxID=54955 RepID=UPI001CC69FA3|nr:uncharacterized protein LOC122652149 [Telopea speciosissima]XP_043701756.1 uncharacterized protein LOC122652149 [Telopea speciosissima]
MALQWRSKCRTLRNPSVVQRFSSSSSSPPESNDGEDKKESSSPSTPSFSSYFSDVKASLKQSSAPRRVSLSSSKETPPFTSQKSSKIASLEEIRKNLAEYRLRSAAPPPNEKPSSSPSQAISFQDLYKRNVIEKSEGGNDGAGSGKGGKPSFDAIRESLRQLRASTGSQPASDRFGGTGGRASKTMRDPLSLSALRSSLKLQPQDPSLASSVVIGGSEPLPTSVFGKEWRTKEAESPSLKTEFVKMYSYGELGEKLRKLRPADTNVSKNWFSLGELNERLIKLREIEEKETESKIGGVSFKDLRESLVRLRISDEDKMKRSSTHRFDILGQLGGTPNFMLSPPKEHLVEKYFHPDNMSSAEKLKLELKKVRDDFKLSESDCGSARVQVAQLTTKIKHLSSLLHKKDKHSRKGLQGMVQKRKKLLKYLRRTDWDSYCFVLSKLGLRDNPDYKN